MLKKLEEIINAFIDHKDSIPFREPVDYEALGLWDYPLKI